MNTPWYARLTPRTASRLKTLAVMALLGALLLLTLGLLWLLENHRA
jgi:hypothetical protein